MNLNNNFIFTNALKNNDSTVFNKIKLDIIDKEAIVGSFEYNGLRYSFGEYLNEDISLLVVNFKAETTTDKNRTKINKLLSEQNKYFPNIKLNLDKIEGKYVTFSLNFAVMSDIRLQNPMAIMLPSIESLLVSFMKLKNML